MNAKGKALKNKIDLGPKNPRGVTYNVGKHKFNQIASADDYHYKHTKAGRAQAKSMEKYFGSK